MGRLRVVLAGATGKTGSEIARALHGDDELDLVAAVARQRSGQDLGAVLGGQVWGVPIESDLEAVLDRERPDVLVDFTHGDVAGRHAILALEQGVRPVVGATGLPPSDLAEIERLASRRGLGAAIVPNFSFGALLLQRFAAQALQFFQSVEIIERHHQTKKDAPSGTAARLARVLAEAGAREPIPIHSLRLPGYVAQHEVVFGGPGETLSIIHESTSRASFAPGVLLAIRRVMALRGVVYDLEALLASPEDAKRRSNRRVRNG